MSKKLVDVLEALNEALSSVSECDDMLRDVENHSSDAKDAAEEARAGNQSAEQMIDEAIRSCQEAMKDGKGEVSPEDVRFLLTDMIDMIDSSTEALTRGRARVFANAKEWGIELGGE